MCLGDVVNEGEVFLLLTMGGVLPLDHRVGSAAQREGYVISY